MNFHIELIGIPGSGKSSLYRHALGSDKQSVVSLAGAADSAMGGLSRSRDNRALKAIAGALPARTRNQLWRWFLKRSRERTSALARFTTQNPELLEVVLRAQSRATSLERNSPRLLEWMTDLFATYQLATENLDASTSLALDEGFCNRAISLFGYGFDERDAAELAAYLQAIPQPDLVLWVDASVELCAARLDRRGWPKRFANLSAESRSMFLHSSRECALATVKLLPPESITRLENDGTLEEAESRVDAALRSILKQA